ncbi:MAG TPA: glucose 1-dehydrogenase [Acidimicrobiales bacterium]|nr:glucose 1-dehydrogenase [Acidimicrobiales bacterium]
MRAVTVIPKTPSSATLAEIPEPDESEGSVLVETLAVGVCGTDAEIVHGDYGWSPPGRSALVLGHESLGRVAEAPAGGELHAGDLVVCIVRRPDPVPCYACAVGQWDACRNGQYTEHGIKEIDGFMRERYRSNPDALVKLEPSLSSLGVLLEPTTVVAKAWAQLEAIGNRAAWKPESCLVVGAGPIGLLAALLARQRGLAVTVVDQVDKGLKPDLVAALGGTYHQGSLDSLKGSADVVIECTGVPDLVLQSIAAAAIGGVVCLTGISPVGTSESADFGDIARQMVLGNTTVVGSVNANRDHYEAGAQALHAADPEWLGRLITRRVPIEHFDQALQRSPDDVKVVIEIGAA